MPNPFRVRDEGRHRAALQYLRSKTRDAAERAEKDDGAEHVHIHLHRGSPGEDLPSSTGNSNPPPGDSLTGPPKTLHPADQNPMYRHGYDQEPDDLGNPRIEGEPDEDGKEVLADLPEPPEGMKYEVREEGGKWAVLLVPDDGANELQAVNTGDNRRTFSDRKTSSILRAMNKANRAAHTRDAVSAATKEQVIFTHTPLPSERLEIRQKGNHYELILISPTTDLTGTLPPGAQELNDSSSDETFPREGEVSSAGRGQTQMGRRTGDRSTASKLKQMNVTNRSFWSRKVS